LEADVKLLANPIVIRMGIALLAAVGAFVAGLVGMRMLRRGMVETDEPGSADPENVLALHTSAIIQQLKQQKFVLENEQQTDRRRSKASEQITAAVMANLPCGVLFIAPNGLVRQANAAARQILGFGSPIGMSIQEVFRDARAIGTAGNQGPLSESFQKALRTDGQPLHLESTYRLPSGSERTLKMKLAPVLAAGEVLGVLAVVSDRSEVAGMQREQILRAESSAEMALELKTSLASIRDWAGKMQRGSREDSRELASDISAEAERLEKVVGGFLAGREHSRAAEA
jgi:PAS domain-containing protein